MTDTSQVHLVHYIPIATTIVAAVFATSLYRRYLQRRTPHLWWWAVGVAFYGLGTLIEATITLNGNTVFLTKAWYIAGAVLGGYPLAQGSLYFSYSRTFAKRATAISLPFVIVTSVLVAMSPVLIGNLQPHRPSGAILGWQWVRLLTPFINTYAAFFLIGGAVVSAWRYAKLEHAGNRAVGNSLIAFGALLPGIGGSMAKAGVVEALYVGEFVGLILIWVGERTCAWRSVRGGDVVVAGVAVHGGPEGPPYRDFAASRARGPAFDLAQTEEGLRYRGHAATTSGRPEGRPLRLTERLTERLTD